MNFLEALERLENSKEFKEWKKENPKSYLAHGFVMDSEQKEKEWQIGYFNPETEKILTFIMADEILINPESDVMNKKIEKLDKEKIMVTIDEAFIESDKVQKQKYSSHPPLKKIAILQKTNGEQVWNITYVTRTFKTINIQVDAGTGNIVSDKIVEVFKFD